MTRPKLKPGVAVTIERKDFPRLITALRDAGYTVIGPTQRDGAIVYEEIESADDLPAGWTDEQEAGKYRLKKRDDAALFGYVVGPHSWKRFLHPPALRLWTAQRDGKNFKVNSANGPAPRHAFIGMRACELAAVAVQDKVFMGGSVQDPIYAAHRHDALFIAVNCVQAGGTCFCVSMKTGPKVTRGHDIALTEVLDGARHYFIAEAGTEKGARILDKVPAREAAAAEHRKANEAVDAAAAQMGRALDASDVKELLCRNLEHPRWDAVAARCLTCANCTMVCPTCFCTTVEEVTDLTGDHAERWRKWDSCFTMDFSYIHGGSVRASARSRYRQWLTHKLATWHDQFGSSGCVGCGRCITWCPVGIDITEEVKAIRQTDGATPKENTHASH